MNPEFKGLLFENVQEILRFPAGAANVNGRLFGGIPAGAVKFIERILQDLDFRNTRKAVMNAGHYGTPEKRMRFFFVATRSGMPMPSWPKPSTVFDKGSSTTSANIYYGPDSSAYSVYGDPEPCAPHSQLLEIVAMSDLPGFEYKDVHLQAQPSAAELEAEQERRQRLPAYSTGYMKKNGYAGKMQQAYIRQPQSNYQRLMRKNLGSDDKLHGHISKGLSDMMTERVCKVELEPGASHLSLPTRMVEEILRGSGRGTHASKWKLKGLYRRHDYLDSFPTATTKLDPGQKMGTILHPSQRRIISVREYARSQGFGDDFIFCVDKKDKKLGVVDSMLRQIGNAVPVPLAKAIGAEIKEACFRQWLAERE
jgi:DNA (cytosine-5)-methyltransferase 1